MPSARKKCICQLCTCGRHMCPHRKEELKASHLVLGEETEKVDDQLLAEIRESRRKKRKQWELSDGETQDVSTAIDQINARQVLADATNRATAVTVDEKGNSQVAVNAAGNSWNSKQVPKRMPIRPPDNIKLSGNGDYTTISQMAYTNKPSESNGPSTEIAAAGDYHQDSWKRQIPKTLPIKIPDSLTLSGPISLETTHKSEFNKTVFENKAAEEGETTHRPRTSLKLSGEFQSDSSYKRAFTPKHTEDVVKVKKGMVKSHLKPEGKMYFDTTSLDYRAAVTEQAKWESEGDIALRPKLAKPQSGIKIPKEPLQDETTAITDYKRWNVGKPERHKPSDTLDLGYIGSETDEAVLPTLAKKVYNSAETAETKINEARWHVSRPVVRKPQNNLKPEGDFSFATTNDVDYSSRRDRSRYSPSNLETVAERTERGATEAVQNDIQSPSNADLDTRKAETENLAQTQLSDTEIQSNAQVKSAHAENDSFVERHLSPVQATESHSIVERSNMDNVDTESQNDVEYVTWDQIRPKAIRPHSNLKQEGGMEFNTTNRSEFIERPSERVKGVRPKTTTKIPEGEFDATTMNQIMFTHDQGERVNPIRPKSNLHVETGDFMDETTTAREYPQWQISRPSPIVHKSSLRQEGSIDFTTTNNTEFEEKHPERVYPIRPSTTNKISGDLDLTTTNQVMHGSFPIQRVQKIVPQPNLRTSSGIFASETTNKTQFQEYQIERPKPIKPVGNLVQQGSMDFTTMNQLQFEEKPFEKVTQFRPKTSSKITGEFDGTTTNSVMFAAQPMPKYQVTKKPSDNIKLENGAFASDTTNHSEYQQWKQSKPQATTPRDNLQQEGSMDFTTSNQVEFAAKDMERVSQIRPQTNPKITGKFDGTTTNNMMYQNIAGERSKAVRPQTNIKVDRGNFNGETTNNRDFKTYGYEKPNLIKPHSSIRQEGNMDFTTTNSVQFEGKSTERATQIRPITATKITGDFDGTTMNNMMFQNNPVEKVKGNRPSTNIQLESGKFENQTTARREFQKWELAKPDPIKHMSTLTQEGTMDFTTSNQLDYGEKPYSKEEQIRPHTTSPITGEFDGTTTNQVMHGVQQIDKVHDIRPRDNLRMQSGEFKGETTTSQEYGYKTGSRTDAIRPKPNISQEGDFDFVTSNQLDFDEKNIDRVAQTRPKTLTKTSDGKFYGQTTNQKMFQAPAMEPVQSVRPSTNIRKDEGAFQTETTNTDAYQQWKLEKPKAFQLASTLKQEGDMNFETTNSTEFKEKGFERVQQIRPKTTSKIEGEFNATTTNQAMFHQPEKLERVKPIRHENNLQLESGKFSNETTTNREYRQWVKDGNQIAVPKKKLLTAGIRSQKEKPNRRKEITSSPKKGSDSLKLSNKDTNHASNIAGIIDGIHGAPEMQTETKADTNVSSEQNQDISQMKSDYGVRQALEAADLEQNLPQGVTSYGASKSDQSQQKAEVNERIEATQFQGAQGENQGALPDDHESWKLATNDQMPNDVLNGSGIVSRTENISNDVKRRDHVSKQAEISVKALKRYKPEDNLKIEHVPFDGASTTRTAYKKLEGRRSSSKKRGEHLKQEGKMEFDTTSNDYSVVKSYQVQRDSNRIKAKTDLRGTLTQEGNMEFSTTSKSSYVGVAGSSRAKNLRPRSSLRLGVSDPSLSQDIAVSSRSNPETSTYESNKDLTSTSRASYVGHAASRRTRANRPSTSQKVGGGTFDAQSTSRSSFTVPQESVVKSRAMKPANHNVLNTDNGHTGNTTYHNSYDQTKGHYTVSQESVVKSRAMKPANHNVLNTVNGYTGNTTYHNSYEQTKGHCPVIDLEAGKSCLAVAEEKNGHIFYAPRVLG